MSCEANSGELAQPHKALKSSRGKEEKSRGSIKHNLDREIPAGRRQLLPFVG